MRICCWLLAVVSACGLAGAQTLGETLVEAQKKLNQYDLDGAYQVVHAVVEKSPNEPKAWIAQGFVDYRRGDIVAAEVDYKRALKLDDKQGQAWLGLGQVFLTAAFRAKAKVCFQTAYKLDPSDREIGYYYNSTLKPEQRIERLETYLDSVGPDEDPEKVKEASARLDRLKANADRKSNVVTTPNEHTEVKLSPMLMADIRRLRGYALPVSVNGNKPVRLLMDSGASGILLNRKSAEAAGVTRIVNTKVRGIGDEGDRDAYVARADKISIGSVEIANVAIRVTDKKTLGSEDGLIGTDMFEQFLVTLDFHNVTLRLDPLPKHQAVSTDPDWEDREIAPEMSKFSPFFRAGHDILIPTLVNDSKPVLFLMDTGATNTIIDPEFARRYTKVGKEELITMRGISGKVNNLQRTEAFNLQFGHYRQPYQAVLSIPTQRLGRDQPQMLGLLGMSTLYQFRIQLDYRDGLVNFDYVGPKY